jgi:phage gp36-like protein
MAYSTQADIENRLDESVMIQLTDDENTGFVVAARVTEAIADADAEIDSHIGVKYALPLASTPAILKKFSAEIAVYNLYRRRHSVPDDWQRAYDSAIAHLKRVAEGKASLGADDPSGSPASDSPQMASDNPERIFSRDKLSQW